MDLNKLPCELQSQLRSDLVARNVSNCVIELVENALDANASCIAVRINFETFRLEVVDNGVGLNKEDLNLVGERYFTSKRRENQATKHFGYRGEGLASIRNVSSRVLIVSRTLDEDTTYCKVIEKSSAEVARSQYRRESVGTTVIIEKFLDKLPVRQRCVKPSEELQAIKWFLQATALMFPKVSFSLRNDNQKSDIFRIDRTNSTAATFVQLFRGAVEDSSSFLKLKTTHESVSAKIMFSKETCNTDQLQFVFVNKRYLPQCNLQKYLNAFLDKADPLKKRISRKIIYVLNLSCPREDYEITFESNRRYIEFKNWRVVEQSLINLVKLISGDDQFYHLEEKIKKPSKPVVSVVDAFHEMNTAHTVFGLPANRQKVEKPVEVHNIDDNSNSSAEIKKKDKEISNSRVTKSKPLRVSKTTVKVSKNTKLSKSPRLADQGIAITYTKSPIAGRRNTEEKRIKNRDISVDKAAASHDDFAWMWKQPDEKYNSDSFENSCSQIEAAKESRVVSTKNKKNKKVSREKKREEYYKSVVAVTNQRLLRIPKHERITKKQNHQFDVIANKPNENYVIEKYGKIKINKNTRYVLKDDSNIDYPCEIVKPNDVPWTAKISSNDNATLLAPMTLFNRQPSPELDFEDDLVSNGNCTLRDNPPFIDEHDTLEPTLPFHEMIFKVESPKPETCRDREKTRLLAYNITPENPPCEALKRDHVVNVETIDPRSKVNDWISKLPPEISLNDSANDYVTPIKNSYLTDQMASDFKHKTKLSKEPDDEPQSPNRTPEKRKSTQEPFEPKCKLKLNFSKSFVDEFRMKNKTCSKPQTKPLLKWNYNLVHRPDPDNVDIIQKKEVDRTQKLGVMKKENFDVCKEPMSLDDCNKNSANFFKDDDVLEPKKTQEIFTQTSDCSGYCRCKCHTECSSQKKKNSQEEKETIILINFADSKIAKKFEPDERNVESSSNKYDENDDTQNAENTVVLSQHFAADSDDMKGSQYLRSKIDLVEKLKFKMNSKFLESSSAVDIPRGMLQSIPRYESKIEKLDENEKKAVVDLVKPYKMQDHITLDDFGNSCLRIFPMLRKQAKKSENLDSENLNCSVVFAKEDIPSFKFIAQIENKFILASAVVKSTQTPVLILLDQHAVDERIRVERLLGEYTDNGEWRSTPINPPIHLNIPFNYSSLFTDYQSNLEEFGLHFEFNNRMKNNETKLIVSFTKVPTCFYNRASREGSNAQAILKQLIESLTKEMLKKFINRGTLVHTVPNELLNVVNYEACRGAVKFGDKLTSQVCSALLLAMAQCKLPFQCAHGRPSVIPLVSFDKLVPYQKEIWEPNLTELKIKLNKRVSS